jgi:hypothetical protein
MILFAVLRAMQDDSFEEISLSFFGPKLNRQKFPKFYPSEKGLQSIINGMCILHSALLKLLILGTPHWQDLY